MPQTEFIAFAKSFYAELSRDNSKGWWDAHKPEYTSKLKAPALELISLLEAPLSELMNDPVKGKLFRPNRDVRFSTDKRPYKEHIHMLWSLDAGGRQDPVMFFGVAPDYVRVGGGIRALEKPVLEDWRKFADLDAKRVSRVVSEVTDVGYTLEEPALVRVPRGYPSDHEMGHLLRMKSVIAAKDLIPSGDLAADLMHEFTALKPFTDLLTSVSCA